MAYLCRSNRGEWRRAVKAKNVAVALDKTKIFLIVNFFDSKFFDSKFFDVKKGLHYTMIYSILTKSSKIWFVGQVVKTLPSHGRIRGSTPLRTVAKPSKQCFGGFYLYHYG